MHGGWPATLDARVRTCSGRSEPHSGPHETEVLFTALCKDGKLDFAADTVGSNHFWVVLK